MSLIEARQNAGDGVTPERRTIDAMARLGQRVDDVHGKRLGTAVAVMVDRQTGAGRWLMVAHRHDLHVCVPLEGLLAGGGRVWCPHEARTVMSGPHIAGVEGLTGRTEKLLCQVYGVEPSLGARRASWERRRVTSVLQRADGAWTWVPPAREESPAAPVGARPVPPALRDAHRP